MTRKVDNTTRKMQTPTLVDIVMLGMPGGIERQESAGQRQLLESDQLPTRILSGTEAEFLALGFTFGAHDESDPIFRPATFPTGWKRGRSDHAMWSYIVDERGIRRVSIFYKAAFYDRSAHMGLCNVGRELSTQALYGDDPITADTLRLDAITPEERAELVDGLDRMQSDITESPTIYGKYANRLADCRALLT